MPHLHKSKVLHVESYSAAKTSHRGRLTNRIYNKTSFSSNFDDLCKQGKAGFVRGLSKNIWARIHKNVLTLKLFAEISDTGQAVATKTYERKP